MTATDHTWPDAFVLDWNARGSPRSRATTSPPGSDRPTSSPARSTSTARSRSRALHATAHGVYEAFVNGTRVGDLELTPGWTAYRIAPAGPDLRRHRPARARATTSSARCSATGGGAARTASPAASTTTARPPRSSPQLDVTLADGRDAHRSAPTASWRSTPSHILGADLIAGEVHDLRRRRRLGRLAVVGRRSGSRTTATTSSCAPTGAAGRGAIEELRPVSVRRARRRGRWVVDVGQNINGWVRLARPRARRAPRSRSPTASGSTTTATSPRSTSPARSSDRRRRSSRSRPTWSSPPASTATCSSRATARKGFQYVRVEGYHGPLDRRRHHRGRRPHRPRPRIGGFAVLRRAHQRASTASPSGASAATPATSPPTAPPASGPGGPATGRSSSRPPRSSTTSAASP